MVHNTTSSFCKCALKRLIVAWCCLVTTNHKHAAVHANEAITDDGHHRGHLRRRRPATHRNEVQCNSKPLVNRKRKRGSLTLSKQFVKRAVIASELAFIAFEDNISSQQKVNKYQQVYDEFQAWDDGLNDASLLVKQNGVCYGVFRGTFQANPIDVLQNINPFSKRVEGTNCRVRKGFYHGYYATYVDEMERAVRMCINSCDNNNGNSNTGEQKQKKTKCPLILTGQSQGASVALVASLALKKYNPTTMAFGPLKVITNLDNGDGDGDDNQCTDVDADNIYTFINASGGIYDDAPYGNPMGKHVGHVILMDEGNAISYTGLNDNQVRRPNARRIHAAELYRTRMQLLLNSTSRLGSSGCQHQGEITITQWENGHWCNYHDECKSGICSDHICTPPRLKSNNSHPSNSLLLRTSGSFCEQDADCESGLCFAGMTCALANGKLGIGASCHSNDECDTGRCDRVGHLPWDSKICAPLRDVGMWCNEDADCIEANCSGRVYIPYLERRCQPSRHKKQKRLS